MNIISLYYKLLVTHKKTIYPSIYVMLADSYVIFST